MTTALSKHSLFQQLKDTSQRRNSSANHVRYYQCSSDRPLQWQCPPVAILQRLSAVRSLDVTPSLASYSIELETECLLCCIKSVWNSYHRPEQNKRRWNRYRMRILIHGSFPCVSTTSHRQLDRVTDSSGVRSIPHNVTTIERSLVEVITIYVLGASAYLRETTCSERSGSCNNVGQQSVA